MPSFNRDTTGEEVVKTFADEVVNKTVVITGPSERGIGAEAVISLAHASPELIVLAGRSEAKIAPVAEKIRAINPKIKTKFVQLDLGDFDSIRAAAKEINSSVQKIDILINNAGIMAPKDFIKTKSGFESQWGANHVGPFLFTNLLMPSILAAVEKAGKPRIINITSMGYELEDIRFDDYNFEDGKAYDCWKGYGQSKMANVLFTKGIASKLGNRGILSFVVHPGLILETHLLDSVAHESFAAGHVLATERNNGVVVEPEAPKSLQSGCATTLVAALDPSLKDSNGAFLRDCALFENVRPYALDPENAEKLWALSEQLVGEKFSY